MTDLVKPRVCPERTGVGAASAPPPTDGSTPVVTPRVESGFSTAPGAASGVVAPDPYMGDEQYEDSKAAGRPPPETRPDPYQSGDRNTSTSSVVFPESSPLKGPERGQGVFMEASRLKWLRIVLLPGPNLRPRSRYLLRTLWSSSLRGGVEQMWTFLLCGFRMLWLHRHQFSLRVEQ